jgi:hypothetical protein
MNKFLLFFSVLFVGFCIQSCSNDSDLSTTTEETFAEDEIADLQNRSLTGKGGCFELIFPVSILLPDGSEVEVADYASMKLAAKEWKKNNPTFVGKVRTQFVFPIEIINQAGETVTIATKEELDLVREECKTVRDSIKGGGHGGHGGPGHGGGNGGHGKECFKISFPVSVLFPDGTKSSFDSGKAMKTALREWRKANPDATVRPALEFPITVTLPDGSTQVIASQEELTTLKNDCK